MLSLPPGSHISVVRLAVDIGQSSGKCVIEWG